MFLRHSKHTHVTHPYREELIGVKIEFLARIKINNKLKVIGSLEGHSKEKILKKFKFQTIGVRLNKMAQDNYFKIKPFQGF